MRKHCRQLDAGVEASGPHDFAVRIDARRLRASTRPSHPAPNVRDDREAPLLEERGTAESVHLICPTRQAKRLRHDGTTGKSLGVREIVSSEEQVLSCPGRGAACSAAPLSRDLFKIASRCRDDDGPRISSATRRLRGASRSIRGTRPPVSTDSVGRERINSKRSVTSALLRLTDSSQTSRPVRNVPEGDIP
jgi:hypothetical protein